ncbi:M1 family metallopeptidase [Flavobacterium alkalisoli]|uniref:M1 family metallopeptidase n=1 Tax=Flavobacterium alkalisoli TaxID=2602769 RepID=A0A5B9FT57_9FLAO|nr:M1 family metallopeptidase [Flavobacterium alkalisoli]QEE50553.1 M1 family metallopeptidase [Flavobacterium alkalisoli]
MNVELDYENKVLKVNQEITFYNESQDTLREFILNDWNNAYSDKTTPLGKRFSDEFVRSFHREKDENRGKTTIYSITNQYGVQLKRKRPEENPDLLDIQLIKPIYPNEKFTINIVYDVKLPNDKFTRYGYDNNGNLMLKDWYLTPARIENGKFVKYSNENLDDIANTFCDYQLTLTTHNKLTISTDLYQGNVTPTDDGEKYFFIGENRAGFSMIIQQQNNFNVYNSSSVIVETNLIDSRVTDYQKAHLIDNIIKFTNENLGSYPNGKIVVSEVDYERNPVYGLNQLPAFITPFPDSFIYEVKFLKTYLNNYLKNTLNINPREDNWIYDALQTYLMYKYVEQYHPDKTMAGIKWGILKGYNLFRVPYNDQYSYLYLLMARKNLDQPIGDPKNTFIKFNEQLAGKYKAGIALNYLESYLGEGTVSNSIKEYFELNKSQQTNRTDFRNIIDSKTDKETAWFYSELVDDRTIIDFKFGKVKRDKDSVEVTIKNKTHADAPVSLYGLKDGQIVFKQWLENIKIDSTFTIARQDADKLSINYENEIPEYNRRNNWKKLNKVVINNKPVKFTFFQDLENPGYNQIFYVPNFTFNLYDGVSVGLRFHNKSLLDKPIIFDITPTYSSKTGTMIGSASMLFNQYIRDGGSLYNIRYGLSGSTYHYEPDAAYVKFTPSVQFRFRDTDLRKNKKQFLLFRYVSVNREQSAYNFDKQNEDYSVFNARYTSAESEIIRHIDYSTDLQIASNFGKLAGEVQIRRLFYDNTQLNLRFYGGMFMYRDTSSDYYSFGLDRPTDYLFDYNFYGRSETTGIYSQQFIMAEGGFKSKLDTRYANQWMTTVNASINVWNWVEVYGDMGFLKNKYENAEFVYDTGIRLNLLTDYFELYFPVYSSNGFELNDSNYSQNIRFVVTLSPGTLLKLFTRKWF